MKKIAFIILAMLLPILPIMADELAFTVDGLNYQHLGGLNQAVRLLGYEGDKCPQKVIIPATVSNAGKTYSVDVISSGAFLGCVDLISVEMKSSGDNGVKYIDPNSFAGCTNLSKVGFSGVLKAIYAPGFSGQRGAFEGCTSLKTIVLPASMDYMGEVDATAPHNICKWAFKNCTGLKTVIINASRPYIEDEAFINCSSLQYFVSYNMHPWSLEWNTFQGIPSTANLIVPDGTKSTYQALLGWNAFNNIDEHSNVDLKAILGEEDQPQGGGTAKLSIQDFTIKAGETKTMLIDMQNPDDQVTLVQFDLRLPDGLSIATGNDATDIAGRTTWRKHTLTSNATNGVTRIMLYSSTNEVIEGTSGAIISIKLTASSSFNGGDIKLENQLMTTPSLVESKPATYTYNIKGGGVTPPVGDAEAYVVYNNGTLTFYCDNKRSSRQGTVYDLGQKYDINKYIKGPAWLENRESIKKAVFNSSFANARPKTTASWFYKCSAMTDIEGIAYLNTSNVTDMSYMFTDCSGLTSLDVSNFNTSNVTDMSWMFGVCSGLTSLDVSNFNTSKVTNMSAMFDHCSGLTRLDVSNFNTSNVIEMWQMFLGCSGLTSLDVSNFNTSKVTKIQWIFANCSGLTGLDVSNFNTSNVTDMGAMFYGCRGLTSIDVNNFSTSNVTNMSFMFEKCSGLTELDLSNFNTSNVMNMWLMFSGCSGLTSLDISNFSTRNVNSMREMFSGSSKLHTIFVNEDNWNIVNVTESRDMFSGCTSLVGGNGTKYDANHIDAEYARIDKAGAPGYFTAKNEGTEPVGDAEPYAVLNSDNTVLTFYYDEKKANRGGMDIGPFSVSTLREWDNHILTIKEVVFDNSFSNCTTLTSTARWFMRFTELTTINGLENLKTDNVTDMTGMFSLCSSLTTLDLSGFNTTNVTSMWAMFEQCSSLTSLDLSGFNTKSLKQTYSMFGYCSNLQTIYVDKENWIMSNVTESGIMFKGCTNLVGGNGTKYDSNHIDVEYARIDKAGVPGYFTAKNEGTEPVGDAEPYAVLSSDNTVLTFYYDDKKESRSGMSVKPFVWGNGVVNSGWYNQHSNIITVIFDTSFANCTSLTSTSYWFKDCENLKTIKGISNLKTDNIKWMVLMFYGCSSLTNIDLSGFKTDEVESLSDMFHGCSSLKSIDLSSFNTYNVTRMNDMFYGCSSLTSLDLNSFNTEHVTLMDNMFAKCSNLQSIYVSEEKWSTINATKSKNIFYGCTKLVGGNGTKYDPNHTDVEYARVDKAGTPGYFTAKNGGTEPVGNREPYVVYNNGTLTFYCDDQRSKRSGTIYSLNEGEAEPEWVLDDNNRNVEKVVFDASFAKARPTSTFQWFFYCDYLTEIKGMENLNTSEVKTMRAMFAFCKHLKSVDVSHFDTKAVLDMGAMFSSCTSLESIDVGHFDSNNVWSMISMFNNCQSLTEINLSSFNTSNVEYLSYLFSDCSNLKTVYFGSGFVSDNSVECEEAFAECQNLSKVVFTGDVPTDINSSFFDGVGTADAPIKLDVPEQYVANYEAKFIGNMFYGGYFTLREAIVPDEKGGKDYGSGNSEIDEKTNLDGSVIGNVYYSIAPENGGYNSAEGCLVVTKPSSDNAFEIDDPFGNDFKGMFTGIMIMVQQGSGIVKVEAESSGGMTLMVKVGNGLPIQMTMLSKSTLAIPYSVDRPTYIYIYAGGSNGNARTRASSDGKLKIYSISWESSASGINSPVGEEQLYDVYSLSGTLIKRSATSLDALPKGVYIVNGRKVVVK